MTYTELKDELYQVRDRERLIRSKLKSLSTMQDDYLARLNNGVTDYSRELLQKTRDPDNAIITVIDDINRDTERYTETIKALRDKNEPYKTLIIQMQGLGGEILRLFFIDGLAMKSICKRFNYSERSAWAYWRKTIYELLEVINEDQT